MAVRLTGRMPWWVPLGGAVLVAGSFKAAQGIRSDFDRAALTKSIEMMLGLQAAGSVMLIVGSVFAA